MADPLQADLEAARLDMRRLAHYPGTLPCPADREYERVEAALEEKAVAAAPLWCTGCDELIAADRPIEDFEAHVASCEQHPLFRMRGRAELAERKLATWESTSWEWGQKFDALVDARERAERELAETEERYQTELREHGMYQVMWVEAARECAAAWEALAAHR